MNPFEIESKIIDFIVDTFMIAEEEFLVDESLVDQGVIDSTGLIELTCFIEKTWNIAVDEQEMNRANFGSVKNIAVFVQKKINLRTINESV